jgi:hypothetical protein
MGGVTRLAIAHPRDGTSDAWMRLLVSLGVRPETPVVSSGTARIGEDLQLTFVDLVGAQHT